MESGLEPTSQEPWLLDPERYAGKNEDAYSFATLLAPEIEKERARLMRSEKAILFESLLGKPTSRKPSQQVPWYELLSQLDLLTRICDRETISVAATCHAIWQLLAPPNWQVFFWMDKWMEEGAKNAIAEWQFSKKLQTAGAELAAVRTARSESARKAADALHSKPGGNRDKWRQIQEAWASGKYSDRGVCAEEEWAAIGFGSLGTARKALVNTPTPSNWPATKAKKAA